MISKRYWLSKKNKKSMCLTSVEKAINWSGLHLHSQDKTSWTLKWVKPPAVPILQWYAVAVTRIGLAWIAMGLNFGNIRATRTFDCFCLWKTPAGRAGAIYQRARVKWVKKCIYTFNYFKCIIHWQEDSLPSFPSGNSKYCSRKKNDSHRLQSKSATGGTAEKKICNMKIKAFKTSFWLAASWPVP